MLLLRWVALAALIVQLLTTRTNLFKKIDPFVVLFNFNSPTLIGWVLLGVLLVTSILIHRPFCKTVCPIGLILGWVSKLPGASILGPSEQCLGCSTCNSVCKINAITRDGRRSILENQECIRCGDCLTNCKRSSLSFHFKGKSHPGRVELPCPAGTTTAANRESSLSAPAIRTPRPFPAPDCTTTPSSRPHSNLLTHSR
jgi:polyferredoxin